MPRRNKRLRMIVTLICVLIVVATVAHAIARTTGADDNYGDQGASMMMEATSLATANLPLDIDRPAPVMIAV